MWTIKDPVAKVSSSYIALNQLELDDKDPSNMLFLSVARLLEYGIRTVHEDMHNHQYTSQNGFAIYFLDKIKDTRNEIKSMPYSYLQFPPSKRTINIINDRKTLMHLGLDPNLDFKIIFDEYSFQEFKDAMMEDSLQEYYKELKEVCPTIFS